MNLYKVPLADPNWRERSVEQEHKLAWDKAGDYVETISIFGICLCIILCIYVAFNAF